MTPALSYSIFNNINYQQLNRTSNNAKPLITVGVGCLAHLDILKRGSKMGGVER